MHLTQCDLKKKKKITKSETPSLNPWGSKSPHLQRGQRGSESSQNAFNYKLWHHGHLVSNRRSSSEGSEGLCPLCLPPDLPYPDSCPEIPTGGPRPSCEPVARVLSDVRMTGGRRKKERKQKNAAGNYPEKNVAKKIHYLIDVDILGGTGFKELHPIGSC